MKISTAWETGRTALKFQLADKKTLVNRRDKTNEIARILNLSEHP